MMQRRLLAAALLGVLVTGACGRKPQPVAPMPEVSAPAPPPPAATAPPAPSGEVDELARLRAILTERVHFDFDRYDIRPDARQVLDAKVPVLRDNPAVRLRIDGHADERGSLEYNQALGMRRAEAARRYLVGFGLDAARFETVSFGEERPLVRASTEAAWAQNRRAEFNVTGF